MLHTISINKIVKILIEKDLLVENHISNSELSFNHVSYDSSKVSDQTLFFCKGIHFKLSYLKLAISNGALAYISEKKYDVDADFILVKDIRLTIAILAPIFFENPADDLNLIGITGTKGKTTVAYFLKNILDEATKTETGLIGTVETITGITHQSSLNTTPEPFDLQNFLDEARHIKLPYFTMEVSSQAFKYNRVLGMIFDHGIWLNIAEDHISPVEHPDFEDYISSKLQLMTSSREVLINKETDYFDRVFQTAQSSKFSPKIYTYASEKYADSVDFYYSNVFRNGTKLSFTVFGKNGYKENFQISTLGLFNVENATAAVAQAKIIGIDDESIRKGLIKTEIPGRMNIWEKKGVTVVVDYAHNALSYQALFESLKQYYPKNKIISVGGQVGNKALQRRKEFGEVVGKFSDSIIITADDPQYEEVRKISEEMASYLPVDSNYEIIEDRVEAISKAINNAEKGDVVVLLSKGTDNTQKVNGLLEAYISDTKLAKQLLGINQN